MLVITSIFHFQLVKGTRSTPPWCRLEWVRGSAWGRPWPGTRSCSSLWGSCRDSSSSLRTPGPALTQRSITSVSPGSPRTSMSRLTRFCESITLNTICIKYLLTWIYLQVDTFRESDSPYSTPLHNRRVHLIVFSCV